MDMKSKRAIYRIKDLSTGEYVAIHFRTDSKAVYFEDGETLEQKIGHLQNSIPPLATIEVDGLLSHLDKQKLDRLTHELIEKIEGLEVSDFDSIREQVANQLTINEELTTEITQLQADLELAEKRLDAYIASNSSVTADLAQIKQDINTNKSAIGNLDSLSTSSKHSLVLAINEILEKLGNYAEINNETISSGKTWSSSKINSELANKSDKNHQHGLHSINDWKTHLYGKEEVDDLLNALALGFTWKTPVDSLDDLPKNPELGWAVIVDERALYVYSEDGWINLGASSLPGNATQEFDGLMSKIDKAKLDNMDADKLAQLDLTRFDSIDAQIAQNIESITNILTKLGVQGETILTIQETLAQHSEQLGLIDFEKLEDILTNIDSETIHQLESDLSILTSTVTGISQSVSGVEEDLETQKTRIDSLESLPRIYYQTEEPEGDIPNGSFWIVGE